MALKTMLAALTLFAGLRLWDGGEAYANPEIDQGFGLSDTIGVAGRFASDGAGRVRRGRRRGGGSRGGAGLFRRVPDGAAVG